MEDEKYISYQRFRENALLHLRRILDYPRVLDGESERRLVVDIKAAIEFVNSLEFDPSSLEGDSGESPIRYRDTRILAYFNATFPSSHPIHPIHRELQAKALADMESHADKIDQQIRRVAIEMNRRIMNDTDSKN